MTQFLGLQVTSLTLSSHLPTRAVFNKLIVTSLKYTPVVLAHHCPYKEVNGK